MAYLNSRRGFLGAAAAGVLAVSGLAACGDDDEGSAGDESDDLREVQVMLGFRWGGDHTFIFAAEREGFFEDEGLDVTFVPPASAGDSNIFVGAGSVDFGLAFTTDHILAAENVEGVVSIAQYMRQNGHGVGALAGTGLTGPEDLRGMNVGVTSLPVSQAMLDAFLAQGGMTREDVEPFVSDFGLPDLLREGQTDANVGVDYGHAILGATGAGDTEFVYFRDFGVPDYPFAVVIANEEFLEDNADVARAFLRALFRGMESAQEDPASAQEWKVEQDEALNLEILEAMWEVAGPQMVDEVTEEQGYGWHDFDGIQDIIDFFVDNDILETPLDANDLATDEYLQ